MQLMIIYNIVKMKGKNLISLAKVLLILKSRLIYILSL